ncbi:AAA domain-containing protein [Hippea sp. KM1]|uniref:AAA domain-containing protein n=1 Tax=Hippea sp. KM1 TaxID=944481 RepID=UPI0004AE077A|nr:AAA domain-containing protein [Hippea sp. KM1]
MDNENFDQEKNDRIENEWLYLFSVVANSDNKIVGLPIDLDDDIAEDENNEKTPRLAVRIKPFWFYLSRILNRKRTLLSANEIMDQIELFNDRFAERFKTYYNTYSYWIIDSSFVIKLAEFWKKRENPFLYYLKQSNYSFIIGIYDGVLRELDTLKDKGGQGNEEQKEKRKDLIKRGLGWLNEIIRTNEYTPNGERISGKHVKRVSFSHELFKSELSKVDFDGLHRKLKPGSKFDDVDKAVVRYAKYMAEYNSPDNVVLLTTDTTMKLFASEVGVLSTGLFPDVYERKQKGLNRRVAKEMVEHFLNWLGLEKFFSPDDFDYPIVSTGKSVENKDFFKEVAKEINEPPSFFVSELDLAKLHFDKSKTLQQYIFGNPNRKMLNPETEIETLKPENIPPARWLTETWAKPFFNQALALSEAYRRFLKNDGSGIISVNGPPGTGKTTILRDIVANIVTQRAYHLANDIINEQNILTESDSVFGKFYRFTDDRLCDYNIVVASSNNKAVENVSKELPLMDKVSEYRNEILNEPIFTHFAECFKNMSNDECWSPISVALGKKDNLRAVIADYIRELGIMLKYLWKINYPSEKERQEAGEKGENLRQLINNINLKQYAKDFLDLYNEIEEIKRLIPFDEMAENNVLTVKDYFETESTQYTAIKDEYMRLSSKISMLDREIKETTTLIDDKTEDMANYKQKNKTAFRFSKIPLLKSLSFVRNTIKEYQQMQKSLNSLTSQKQQLEESLSKLKSQFSVKERIFNLKTNTMNKLLSLFEKLGIENADSKELEFLSILNAVYNSSDKEKQLFTPYAAEALERKRKELFFKALRLHYAFVLKHRQEFKHNIDLFFGVLNGGGATQEITDKDIGAIVHFWTAFAFITPVISTTFHSVTNMFATLTKPNSIGFVIIDEAGQGIPYYAVGLLMRAKRAIIVGDPLQIEPVITIPESLRDVLIKTLKAEQIAGELGVGIGLIVPGLEKAVQISESEDGFIDTSVQVLADRASSIQAVIERDGFKIPIGIPLRVHFRCKDPAFSIANTIAYSNTMIHGNESNKNTGRGYFVDVDTSQANWTKNVSNIEINTVNEILLKMYKDRLKDVYIISPFVGITFDDVKRKFKGVPKGNIGTVHTFQGKENKVVIILLGGDKDGAIKWATRKPNLLNVAVTRSKEELVIVGDIEKWTKNGGEMFRKAIELLKPLDGLGYYCAY